MPQPPHWRPPRKREAAQEALRVYIEAGKESAETALERLGKPRDAWRIVEAFFGVGATTPIYRHPRGNDSVLGREYRVIQKATRSSQELPAYKRLQRIARRIERAEALAPSEGMRRACERYPALYERYRAEYRRTCPKLAQTWAWHHAYFGATMEAALHQLDDPAVMFAAGKAIGEYFQRDLDEARRMEAVRAAEESALVGGYRAAGKKRQEEYREQVEPVHQRIAELLPRLRDRGLRPNAIATHLARDEPLQALAIACRGKRYTQRGLRGIVDRKFKTRRKKLSQSC
jgi:hypothetical protein